MNLRPLALVKRIGQVFGLTGPFPWGSQNRDGFERNLDTRMTDRLFGRDDSHALVVATVWACVKLVSETIATLPLNPYQRQANGSRLFARDFALGTILRDAPNAAMTAKSFWQAYILSILLNGVAYAEKRISNGRIVALDYLDFNRVSWSIVNGEREYRYTPPNGVQRIVPADRLFRTIGFSLDGIDGLSAIQYGCRMFDSARLADTAANSTFHRGLMQTVGFKMEQILKKEQRNEFRENFQRDMAGAMNAGKPFLLEGGMNAITIGINPVDAQLLESRAWSVEEICRWFGVPPFMVGHSEKSTSWGTGLEQQNLGFLTYCLRPIMKSIEQSITKDLLTVRERFDGFYFEFAVEGLLRVDSKTRAELYSSALQNGWMTREEVRELENLPNIGGADKLTVQSNLVYLNDLGKGAAPATALEGAMKNFLGMVTP